MSPLVQSRASSAEVPMARKARYVNSSSLSTGTWTRAIAIDGTSLQLLGTSVVTMEPHRKKVRDLWLLRLYYQRLAIV